MEPLGASGGRSGRNVEDVLSEVGSRVRKARRAREMTIYDLGGASGISVARLSRLESGIRYPSLATVLNVAAGLGVSVSELVEVPRPGTVVRGAEAPIFEGEGFRFQPLMPEAGPQGPENLFFGYKRVQGGFEETLVGTEAAVRRTTSSTSVAKYRPHRPHRPQCGVLQERSCQGRVAALQTLRYSLFPRPSPLISPVTA